MGGCRSGASGSLDDGSVNVTMSSSPMYNMRSGTAYWRSTIYLFLCSLALAHSLRSQSTLTNRNHLRVITDDNWEEILEGEWMLEFFAPWCPVCQQLQPVWSEFAEWAEDVGVNVAHVDVTEQPGLSGRFIITALPTIYHCKDGMFRRYQGARTKDDFISFIDEKKWQGIEPVSSWFAPSSWLMNTMSALFKLSVFIRHCHNYLTEKMEIPVWGSYAIFALVTLFSGLTLGLILVFIADCVFPSRQYTSQNYCQKKQTLVLSKLIKQLEDDHEADGEDEDEEELDGERDKVWKRRRVYKGQQESNCGGLSEEVFQRRVRDSSMEDNSLKLGGKD